MSVFDLRDRPGLGFLRLLATGGHEGEKDVHKGQQKHEAGNNRDNGLHVCIRTYEHNDAGRMEWGTVATRNSFCLTCK